MKCGAIVNAANSGMTGCYVPCHNCIDNCIHTFAGVRLRYRCGEIMKEKGHEEPTGQAEITPAYNLPCDYVIHTAGAIVQGELTAEHCKQLKSCYENCLEIAVKNDIKSIEFQEDMKIPSELIPKCPKCGKPVTMNLSSDDKFAEDEGWHKAAERYSTFLHEHERMHILFLELGVGYNTLTKNCK